MPLYEKGYGKKKDIPATIMAGSTFDDILCIVVLGIVQTLTYIDIEAGSQSKSSGFQIGMIFIQLGTGVGIAIVFGFLGWFFKFVRHQTLQMYLKAFYCIAFAVGDIIATNKSKFS
jgi:hypothetical protein